MLLMIIITSYSALYHHHHHHHPWERKVFVFDEVVDNLPRDKKIFERDDWLDWKWYVIRIFRSTDNRIKYSSRRSQITKKTKKKTKSFVLVRYLSSSNIDLPYFIALVDSTKKRRGRKRMKQSAIPHLPFDCIICASTSWRLVRFVTLDRYITCVFREERNRDDERDKINYTYIRWNIVELFEIND